MINTIHEKFINMIYTSKNSPLQPQNYVAKDLFPIANTIYAGFAIANCGCKRLDANKFCNKSNYGRKSCDRFATGIAIAKLHFHCKVCNYVAIPRQQPSQLSQWLEISLIGCSLSLLVRSVAREWKRHMSATTIGPVLKPAAM